VTKNLGGILETSYSTDTCWFLEFEFYYRVEAFLVCTYGSTSRGSKADV